MAEKYDVTIKVISQKGNCAFQHKVGDEWLVENTTPQGICLSAFSSLFPDLRTLSFGGTLPWEPDPDTARIACPDFENPVVFELRRIKK